MRWAVNDNDLILHRVFGEGRIVGVREKDVFDIDFDGRRRSIKLGPSPLRSGSDEEPFRWTET
jgi:hypothetical protein